MVIAHLTYDRLNLITCSLTCRSWYIAAVPHLHHTLTIASLYSLGVETRRTRSLLDKHHLCLLPLVKKFRIDRLNGSSPDKLIIPLLPQFFALTNVRELEIEGLDIPSLIPSIQRYFQNILPTLRSLTLRTPYGSPRQILYFVGQFQYLEDLTLLFLSARDFLEEPVKSPVLVPPFTPPLRGRLRVRYLTGVLFPKTMIEMFGGIRSRHVSLHRVDGMSLLLGACAERLETLQLHLHDPWSQ